VSSVFSPLEVNLISSLDHHLVEAYTSQQLSKMKEMEIERK